MAGQPFAHTAEHHSRDGTLPSESHSLAARFDLVRRFTELLCEPLETEDFVIQSMPDVSPTRWHLAHTTWFFETFVLSKTLAGFRPYHPKFVYLFNSYYNLVGQQFPRPRRGLLSRPTVKDVFDYRAHVDRHMRDLLDGLNASFSPKLARTIEIGVNHEQQHQELILTDLKHIFSCNPLSPVYRTREAAHGRRTRLPVRWIPYEEGVRWIGHQGDGFRYDNEGPRHHVFVHAFELADRLVTNAEYMDFMKDGGYARSELWLSEGWATVQEQKWTAPLYWRRRDGRWWSFTLSGMRPIHPNEPVCHVSYYEADAYARWAGNWLPTEAAWELAANKIAVDGNLLENERFHPEPPVTRGSDGQPAQIFGDVWEWTCSPYVAYPGFRPPEGALGEYNGKFMCSQMVLRGGSFATPRSHIRHTYRNFFPPNARWQFTGIRLAREPGSGSMDQRTER